MENFKKGVVFLFALFTFFWAYSASFHSPIVVDYGVLIDRSWRIFMGQVPGRDFYCPTTPLTYMIQAALFKIFSPQVFWMKVYLASQMVLCVILAGFFAWKALKLDFKIVAFAVLPLTAVWAPGNHQLMPWYDVDAVFFSFLTLCALGWAFSMEEPPTLLFFSGMLSCLSFLSKQNIGGGCVIAALAFIMTQTGGLKSKIKAIAFFSLGAVVPAGLLAAYFLSHHALRDGVTWMFVRASQRYGKGELIRAMWDSNWKALMGHGNNFLKFVLPFYIIGIVLTWRNRGDKSQAGQLRFSVSIYCLIAMWIGILQEAGMRYSSEQVYLGLVAGVLLIPGPKSKVKNLVLSFPIAFMFLWGALAVYSLRVGGKLVRWRQSYDAGEIRWTVKESPIQGIYFRKPDFEIVKSLIAFEQTIPKNDRVFIMPDPLFFYFATGRLSPVPITHFYVSGWELNVSEKNLIPECLVKENVRWVLIAKEQYFDTGFLRFAPGEDWKTAVKNNRAMMSRGDYSLPRDFIDKNYEEVPGPECYWTLKRRI